MDRDLVQKHVSYPQLIKAGIVIMTKFMMVLVVLAFFHNLFAVDIHINQAKHEFAVKLTLNEAHRIPVDRLLKLAGHYFLPQGNVSL